MNIHEIDVVGLQFPQTVFDGNVKTLGRVTRVIDLNRVLLPVRLVRRRVFGGKNNVMSIPAFDHPLS